MACGGPTRRAAHFVRVIVVPDEDASSSLRLRVAAKAQIGIGLHKQLAVDGAMRLMASRTAFPECLVLEHKMTRLFPVAVGALLVQSRHGQTAARWFHNVEPVRIVALHTVHLPFAHRVMLRKVELGMDLQVTRETGLRVAAGIDDKPAAPATRRGMFAAGAVAGFTSR